jgi:uncharacterized membrane protein YvlD (DUF360 family)
MALLITWIILTLGLFVASKVLDGMTIKGGIGSHLLVSALFGLLNVFLGGFLFHLIGIGTLGLGYLFGFITRLIVTALMLVLVDKLSTRLTVKTFGTAFLAALIVSVVGTLAEWALAQS